MILFTLLVSAFAAPPVNGNGYVAVGSGSLERLSWSLDGEYVLGRDRGTGQGFVVGLDGWDVHTLDACSVSSVTSATEGDALGIYVGCDNGRIYAYDLEGEVLSQRMDGDDAVYWQLPDTDGNAASFPIPALFWNQDTSSPRLYALQSGDPDSTVHVVDLVLDDTYDDAVVTGYPYLAAANGFVDGEVVGNELFLVNGDTDTTIITLASGAVALSPLATGVQLYGIDDVTHGGTSGLWVADGENDAVYRYTPRQGTYQVPLLGVGSPTTLARNTTSGDEWMIFASDDRVATYAMTNNAFDDITSPVWVDDAPPESIVDLLAGPTHSIGGTDNGKLRVLTDRPWIDEVEISPAAGVPGDRMSLSFRIDEEGANWQVRRGTDRGDESGVPLASGTTTQADEVVTVALEAGEAWEEGANRLYVLAAGDNLLEGHARATFTIDTVPDAPVLPEGAAGFTNNGLLLAFDGIEDEDLSHYIVYLSDEEFTPEQYEVGGPSGPEDGPETPLQVDAEPGARVTVPLRPLVNGTTYYLAVRAVDAGGLESPMSNVITGVPEEAFSAADLANESGGSSCATTPGGGPAVVLVGLFAIMARRSRSLVMLAGLLSLPAAAAEEERNKGDMTKQVGNFEIRYGTFLTLDDQNIKNIFCNAALKNEDGQVTCPSGSAGHEMLQVEFGPQITRLLELDLQVGFYQELATTISEAGERSSQRTMLTLFPLGASASLRLHVIDEQVVVPFARLGMDYVYFSELTDQDEDAGKEKVGGSKVGHHYGLGANVLLDVFAPARASLLEAQTGINDTYITFEYRRQNIDARKTPWGRVEDEEEAGLDFSGGMFTAGLKLDF